MSLKQPLDCNSGRASNLGCGQNHIKYNMIYNMIPSGDNDMTALSIIIPDALAQDSSLIAKKMHISRSQFIRLAIENEIKAYQLKKEQQAMVAGFKAIKQHAAYLDEMDDLEQLDIKLKDEAEFWWKRWPY